MSRAKEFKGMQPLPHKETNMFKQILKAQEDKMYKRALKLCEQILRNHPDHGETLSMKGLVLNGMGKKEDGYKFAKEGLRKNMTSGFCWHILGILYKSEKLYTQALSCYRKALETDSENEQLMRELAQIEVHVRDHDNFVKTRHKMLLANATRRSEWVGFIVSLYLAGKLERSLDVLESFESTMEDQKFDFETSELSIYKIRILYELERKEKALEACKAVLDKSLHLNVVREYQAKIYRDMGEKQKTVEEALWLIQTNPENSEYHEFLQKSIGLEKADLLSYYKDLLAKYPKSHYCTRIQLDFAEGEEFDLLVQEYIMKKLRKGAPSLFRDLHPLYATVGKRDRILKYLLELRNQLTVETGGGSTTCSEGPHVLLWLYYYLASHYNALGDIPSALTYLKLAKEHTPTCIDVHTLESKIFGGAGDAKRAAESAEKARKFDLADRNLNVKATKRLLRAGRIEEAEGVFELFSHREGDYMTSYLDIQCIWFEMEKARAHEKAKEYGRALRQYSNVVMHFGEFKNDQFDFHQFAVRKATITTYFEMLKFEDELYKSKKYIEAAHGVIRCYLELHDNPIVDELAELEKLLPTLTSVERKKTAQKIKRIKKKREKKQATKQSGGDAQKKGDGSSEASGEKSSIKDPDGEEFLREPKPLEKCLEFAKILDENNCNDAESLTLIFKLAMRRKKYLQALRAMNRSRNLNLDIAIAHRLVCEFFHEVKGLEGHGEEVFDLNKNAIFGSSTVEEYNENFLIKNSDPHSQFEGLRLKMDLFSAPKDEILLKIVDLKLENADMEFSKMVLEYLKTHCADEAEMISEFVKAAQRVFPFALFE